MKTKKVIGSMAVQELSWDFAKLSVDAIKYRRLNSALESLLSEPLQLERIQNKIDHEDTLVSKSSSKRSLDNIHLNSEQNIHVVPTMCVLLKFYELSKLYDVEKDYKIIFKNLCSFMASGINMVGAYELSLLQRILFSQNIDKVKEIRRLLKLDSKSDFKKNLWNASYDITFMRSLNALPVQAMRGEPINSIYNPVLVTKDIDLASMTREILENTEIAETNGKLYPHLRFELEKEEDKIFIFSCIESLKLLSQQRYSINKKKSLSQRMEELRETIKQTEERINTL
ncbi:hypothetical protein [Paenibacillus sp. FSL R5-192]|uniref:hypothetical protein n=1 Tax=Paenibacillus sp. FSL R5-192 TaxID=1226754 RepID=UPI0012EC58A5|nr:hypothetical protein [Paenibacillus sp. FSL R5-192]